VNERAPSWRTLLRRSVRYASTAATVLITGETGVGKDALARYLHASGPRRGEPFVTVDCPAIPATLLEAELFGHERGAFTDATRPRAGRFELAGNGTVYLDSVTSLPLSGQGTLLRVLEERAVTRLGSTTPVRIGARIIASADASIEQQVLDGRFRLELFHRLRVLPIDVPPLRERPSDILPAAGRFVADICRSCRRRPATISADAREVLVQYHWPGNARELRNVLERALLNAHCDTEIRVADLPLELLDRIDVCQTTPPVPPPTLEHLERRYITLTLRRTRGNQARAAAILGISRKTLWEKRKRFGLG